MSFLLGLTLGLWVREVVYRCLRLYARAHKVPEVVADPVLQGEPKGRREEVPTVDKVVDKLRGHPAFAHLPGEQLEVAARQIVGRG